jgi:uncharacterized FlgJ-related protein
LRKLEKLLLILLLISSVSLIANDDFKLHWREYLEELESAPQRKICDSLVLKELKKHNIPFEKKFLHRIKLESGNYKSKLSTEYNNITGMRFATRRNTTATGKNRFGYASFNCWIDCIRDLKLFIEFSPPKQNETYYGFMKRRGFNEYYKKK